MPIAQRRPEGDLDAAAGTRAALIYLHSTSERQHTLADTVGKVARTQMGQVRKSATGDRASGTKVARPPTRAS